MSVAPPRSSLLLLAYLAFVSLGLPDGLLGVGWPSISAEFGVPTGAVGLVLTAGTVGYLTSSVLAGFTLARLGVGRLLAGSTLLASLALTGYATAPALTVLICCALVLGLGSGAIDSGLNAYAAGAFGPRHMNWMHAFFGLGVAIGPLVMTAMLSTGAGWRWGYAVTAAAQLALATAFALTVGAWRDRAGTAARPASAADDPLPAAGSDPLPAGSESRSERAVPVDAGSVPDRTGASVPTGPAVVRVSETLRLPAVWFGALAFAVYVAIEVSAGLYASCCSPRAEGCPPPSPGCACRHTGAASSSAGWCRGWWPSGSAPPGCCGAACWGWRPVRC